MINFNDLRLTQTKDTAESEALFIACQKNTNISYSYSAGDTVPRQLVFSERCQLVGPVSAAVPFQVTQSAVLKDEVFCNMEISMMPAASKQAAVEETVAEGIQRSQQTLAWILPLCSTRLHGSFPPA